MLKTTALALALATVLASGVANAAAEDRAEEVDFDGRGYGRVYVGSSFVTSWLPRVEDDFSNSIVNTQVDESFGLSVTYGVRLERFLSVEAQFEWLEGHELMQTSVFGPLVDNLVYYSLDMVFGFRPINHEIFDPFISVGGGWTRVKLADLDIHGDGFAFRFGIGSDFWITDHIGLRVEGRYLLPVSNEIEDLDSVGPSVGVFYRF